MSHCNSLETQRACLQYAILLQAIPMSVSKPPVAQFLGPERQLGKMFLSTMLTARSSVSAVIGVN